MEDVLEHMTKLTEEAKEQQERYRVIISEASEGASGSDEPAPTEVRQEQIVVEAQLRPGSLEDCMEASRHTLKSIHDRDESIANTGVGKDGGALGPADSIASPRRLVRSALGAVSHKAHDYYEGAKEKASQAYAATQDSAQVVLVKARQSFKIGSDPSTYPDTGETGGIGIASTPAGVDSGAPQVAVVDSNATGQDYMKGEAYSGKPFEGETIRQAVELDQREKEMRQKEGSLHSEDEAEHGTAVPATGLYAEVVANMAAEMLGLQHKESKQAEVDDGAEVTAAGRSGSYREDKDMEHVDEQSAHPGGWKKVQELVMSKHVHPNEGQDHKEDHKEAPGLLSLLVDEDIQVSTLIAAKEPPEEDKTYHEATVMQNSLN